MRVGHALKRWTTTSPLMKVTSPYFWMNISVHKAKYSSSSSDCDFVGAQGKPEMLLSQVALVEQTPEKMVFIGNGELVLTDKHVLFHQSSSPAHSSLMIQWGTWDNSLIVRTTSNEAAVVKLHSHPSNMVGCVCVCIYVYASILIVHKR